MTQDVFAPARPRPARRAGALWVAIPARADIGQIKVAKGQVSVERKGADAAGQGRHAARAADVLKTGADGSVGITMSDNSLLSAGPNSILSLDRYEFDPTTSQGRFDASLQHGLAGGDLGPHRQAVAGRDDGAHAVGDPRRARHRVRGRRSMSRPACARGGASAVCGAARWPPAPTPKGTVVLLPERTARDTAVTVTQGGKAGRARPALRRRAADAVGPRTPTRPTRRRCRRSSARRWPRSRRAPAQFTLYFVEGKDEFTDESKRLRRQRLRRDRAARPVPDVLVIGHTDAVGSDAANDALSQAARRGRARAR